MKLYISLILFLSFCINSQAQNKILCPKYNVSINSHNDLKRIEKINHFLNDSLEKIVLVRIKPHYITEIKMDPLTTSPVNKETIRESSETIIKNDSLEHDKIADSINLNDSDFVRIIRFMFPMDKSIRLPYRCGYEPRNGILFYGAGDKFLGFIEICFKCHGHSAIANSLPPIKIDGDDFNELKSLFQLYNISVH